MKTIEALFTELEAKVRADDPASGTVALVRSGVHEIGKKLVEEAAETWMAAEHESADRCAQEASQLVYHVLALLLARGLTLEDVERHL